MNYSIVSCRFRQNNKDGFRNFLILNVSAAGGWFQKRRIRCGMHAAYLKSPLLFESAFCYNCLQLN